VAAPGELEALALLGRQQLKPVPIKSQEMERDSSKAGAGER